MDDCVICVAAMVMGSPYNYERVLKDSSKYQKVDTNGKYIPWWETYLMDEGFNLHHWRWSESDLNAISTFISRLREEAAGILTMNLPGVQRRHIVAVDSMGVVDPAVGAPPHESLDRYISERKSQGVIFDDQYFVTAIRGTGAPIVSPGVLGARLGRNAACWCGSGLKYKRCHGRLTP
jgi:hypothetical protein